VNAEGLREVSKLTGLTSLALVWCPNVTAEAMKALRTALPNLKIDYRALPVFH